MNNQPLGYSTQSFNVELAQRLKSSDLAILVQFFINCIAIHKQLRRNFKEGRTWNFCTRRELSATFPWLSIKQCERLLKKLVDQKILMKGNFNKMPGDNTVWYAFCDEGAWNLDKEKNNTPPLPKSGDPSRNRASNTTVLPTVLPVLSEQDNVLRDGGNVDNSKPILKQKKTMETLASSLQKGKTLDASRRWRLTPEQLEAFNFLDGDHIDTDEGTKAHWSKTYSLQRIIDVYEEAKAANPNSLGAYMQKLLKIGANVSKAHAAQNLEYAKYFKDKTGWQQLEIMKKYVKLPCGDGKMELDFNMPPEDFQRTLMNKYANRN